MLSDGSHTRGDCQRTRLRLLSGWLASKVASTAVSNSRIYRLLCSEEAPRWVAVYDPSRVFKRREYQLLPPSFVERGNRTGACLSQRRLRTPSRGIVIKRRLKWVETQSRERSTSIETTAEVTTCWLVATAERCAKVALVDREVARGASSTDVSQMQGNAGPLPASENS